MQSLVALLAPWGALRTQPSGEWQGPPDLLPDEVARFYREVGPWGAVIHESVGPIGLTINTDGNPVEIPPLNKLWWGQAGFAWSRNPDVPLSGWRLNWLVIGEEGANPFIFDRNDGRVLFAFAGMGKAGWQPRIFAEDLTSAMGGIATVANALAALGDDARDEEFNLKPDSRDYVHRQLASFLGSTDKASEMLAVWKPYA